MTHVKHRLQLFCSGGTFTNKFYFKTKMWFVIWFDLGKNDSWFEDVIWDLICDLPITGILVRGTYYTAPGCDVIHDVFVLFTFAIVEVIWFGTLASDQCLTLHQVMHINKVSDETFGLWHVSDVFVLFTFGKIEVIWFGTLISGQSSALFPVISYASFPLRYTFPVHQSSCKRR